MKLTLQKKEQLEETEVTVVYQQMNERLHNMIRTIQQFDHTLTVKNEGMECFIPLEDLLYIDYVDGKTFVYTKNVIYESNSTVTNLESELDGTTIIRIGKNTLCA